MPTKPDQAIEFALGFDQSWFDSLLAKADLDPETGCLIWTGGTNNGYAVMGVTLAKGVYANVRVHRLMYARANGYAALPKSGPRLSREQLVIDHKCRNKACINPNHLRKIPNYLNVHLGHAAKAA